MATTPVKEDAFLASQCLDFCQVLAGKSLSFSFSLKIGTNFSFSLDTRGEATLSSAKKKKKQTPSTLRRNARRREQFLQKKLASPAPVSEKGTEALQKAPTSLHHHPSPPPSSERRQVITVGKGKAPTFNQLDGAVSPPAKSAGGEEIADAEPMYSCDDCEDLFFTGEDMDTHMKEIHKHSCIINGIFSSMPCPGCLVP